MTDLDDINRRMAVALNYFNGGGLTCVTCDQHKLDRELMRGVCHYARTGRGECPMLARHDARKGEG